MGTPHGASKSPENVIFCTRHPLLLAEIVGRWDKSHATAQFGAFLEVKVSLYTTKIIDVHM